MTANVNSGLTYVITNVKAGTAIDLSDGDNRTVTGWTAHGESNQRWTTTWTGNSWTFRNNHTGTFLATDGSSTDGTRLVATTTPFEWHIWRDQSDSNTFRIFVPNTKENLDLYGQGDPAPGTPVTLWYTWSGLHQTWKFTQV